jgi:polyphosphate kinase
MQRNLDRRVEIVFPVLDEELAAKALHVLEVELEDNVKARILQPDGEYIRVDRRGKTAINSQRVFVKEAAEMNPGEGNAGNERVFIPAEAAEESFFDKN